MTIERLTLIGAKVVCHGRYVAFQMAEVAIPRQMFQEILRLIAELRPQPPPAPGLGVIRMERKAALTGSARLLTTSPILFSDCGSRRTLVWSAARASSASFRYGVFNNRSPNLQH